MNELKRYKPVLANTGETPWPNVKITEAAMQESETGDWVRYEDVNKIRAQAVRECAAALEIDTLRNGSDAMYMRDYANKIERGEA